MPESWIKRKKQQYEKDFNKIKEHASKIKEIDVKEKINENRDYIAEGTIDQGALERVHSIIRFAINITLVVAIIGIIFSFGGLVSVSGESMESTYHDGQHLLYHRTTNVSKGDVIIFNATEEQVGVEEVLIKRVIATEGDTVYAKNGIVYVNNEAVKEDYTSTKTDDFTAYTVDEGCVFVMGDNRSNSLDSRIFGAIDESQIMGIVNQKE